MVVVVMYKHDVILQKKPWRQTRVLITVLHSTDVDLFLSIKICRPSLVRKPKAKGVMCGFKSTFFEECANGDYSEADF